MRARPVVAVIASFAVVVACSSGGETKQQPAASASGQFLPPTSVTTVAGDDPAATSTDPAAGGDAQTPDVNGAQAALATYLDALAANDFPRALTTSQDALQSLTAVRSIINTSNADKGGKTTSTFDARAFDVGDATLDQVQFTGRTVLTSTVSGPAGPPATTTDTMANIVVRRSETGWRVADATYNDAPLVSFLANATTSIGSVQVTLSGALAFGNSLAVVVQLAASGDHTVGVSSPRLRINDEEAGATSALVVPGQPGFIYATFPRRDERPTEWRATITVDGNAQAVSLAF